MPRSSYADVQLDVDAGGASPALDPIDLEVDDDTPFRVLVIGDFGAYAAVSKPVEIDRDNFDDVLESLDVRAGIAGLNLRFLSMTDFHPDELRHRVPAGVRTTQQPKAAPAPPAAPPPVSGVEAALGGSLLDAALEATETRAGGGEPAASQDPFAQYLRSIVEPHLAGPEPGLDFTDAIRAMRGLLHHPRFQQLESAWRGLHRLVHGLDTGPGLSIHVLHMAKADLISDLGAADDLRKTALFRVLAGNRWSVIVANCEITPAIEDLNMIARAGMIAKQARAALLAGASPKLLGCPSLADSPYPDEWNGETDREGWDLIRGLPEARNIGLVLPRFLLRLPYGKEGEVCDEFPFEEFEAEPRHEEYLWGNGALAAAFMLGVTYSAMGWQMRVGAVQTMDELPLHVYREGGESKIKPCAEVFLSMPAIEAILDRGLMPLVSQPNVDKVRLAGFRSIAAPAAALAGPWK